MIRSYDYVVVGGGSAGCIVAAELCKHADVLLLEHGPDAESHRETLLADGYTQAFINDALLFDRFSDVDPRWGNRRVFMGTGHGLGGSGAVNAMVYTRGAKLDYDEWPEGWRWRDLEPVFAELEATLRPRPRPPTEWTEACIAAAVSAGFRRSEDLNDGDLTGVLGYEAMNYEGHARRSSYVAFLEPARSNPRLTVETHADVHRIVLHDRRVSGVEYRASQAEHRVQVRREVILCAGALESPRILMRSGIGPGEELRRHGTAVHLERAGVGRNLHDHPNVQLFFGGRGAEVDCKYPQLYGFHRVGDGVPDGQSDTCYVFYPARSSFREGMMRLLPGIALPAPLYDVPVLREAVRRGVAAAFAQPPVAHFVRRLWGIVVILGKPKSRGEVRLDGYDPGYFADPADMETVVRGVALARKLATQPAMRRFAGTELLPGPMGRSRGTLERWIRGQVMTTYHFAGTCRMGTDSASVVDPELRVRGVSGIRVADASVVPFTPVSAMNAPSMMIGKRAASLVLRESRRDSALGLT